MCCEALRLKYFSDMKVTIFFISFLLLMIITLIVPNVTAMPTDASTTERGEQGANSIGVSGNSQCHRYQTKNGTIKERCKKIKG